MSKALDEQCEKQTLANQLLASTVSLGQIVRILNAIPMPAETRNAVQKVINEIGDEQKELYDKIKS